MVVYDIASTTSRLAAAAAGWKTILVHAEAGPEGRNHLRAAVALAEDLDAHILGVAAESIEPMAYSDPYMTSTGPFYAGLQAYIDADLKAAEAAFEAEARNTRRQLVKYQGRPAPTLAAMARGADVIVARGGLAASGSARQANAAELAIASGRPVLVAPVGAARLRAEVVVVAWKDTRESRRALSDALPLLKSARDVLILAICEAGQTGDLEAEVQDVLAGLRRHDVSARIKVVNDHAGAAADRIDEEAAAIGADLVVAGCYGRTRFNEWLFGGVTRDLLEAPERFLLLSH